MKKLSNFLGVGRLQLQKRRMNYFVEEAFQHTLRDPLLRKLDCKLR